MCASARTRVHARGSVQPAIEDVAALRGTNLYGFRRSDPVTPIRTTPPAPSCPAPPADVTILKHCRCRDCRHWIDKPAWLCARGLIGHKGYPPDAWHYCALYDGPQVSRDVWVWPKAGKKWPASGLGGPDDGPNNHEPAGVSRSTYDSTAHAPGAKGSSENVNADRDTRTGEKETRAKRDEPGGGSVHRRPGRQHRPATCDCSTTHNCTALPPAVKVSCGGTDAHVGPRSKISTGTEQSVEEVVPL